ncbi:hypothetical protein K1719_003128 [Acacia pycnantha]|nr:hypothetical protein K1719_003128 [Acacia pycnantha]
MSTDYSNGDCESLHQPLLHSGRSRINSTSQVAIVGANVCPIESLDYEIIENEFFKQDWRSRGKIQILQYLSMKWVLCLLIGAIVGVVGFFHNLAVETFAGLKFVITSDLMLQRRFLLAFVVFCSSNLVLILFSTVLTAFIAPAAAGSGIPEVKAYLNGVDAPGVFTLRTLIVKVIGSITAVSSSLLVGKAGPMNDRDRRDLITCGAAAGMAAAFRAPVGGVLFAFEEMASWWRSALLWRTFFTTAVVAIVLRSLIDFCLSGKCGPFGKGGLIMFDVNPTSIDYHLANVLPAMIIGVVGGILGSLYNALLTKVLRVYNMIHEKYIQYKILLACIISIITSCLIFGLPWLASCQPCPVDAAEECPTIGRSGNYKKFQCPPGHYNDLASLFFNTCGDAIKNLFSTNTDEEFAYSSMFTFFISCFFLSIFSYGVVAPAGLFVPNIVIGASYGRVVGMMVGKYFTLNHGLYAVLGAASFLGGSMRMTVSLCVILLELTNNLSLLPLVMVSLLTSKTVADAFNPNIYDIIMKAKGFPYLKNHVEPYMRQLTVGDVVTGPLHVFNGIEKVRNIVFILRTSNHNGFPVVDEPPYSEAPVLYGIILRDHLLTLLKKKDFLPAPMAIGDDAFKKFSADEFAKKGSGNSDKIEDLLFTEEELDMFIDLHPFSNASPYTVLETMSLGKALTFFRNVGLRHLLVIPRVFNGFPVVGILTRHDFIPEHILGLHPSLERSRWRGLRIKLPFRNLVAGYNIILIVYECFPWKWNIINLGM